MMSRMLWLSATILVAAVVFYLSRFWVFDLWPREGLFGWADLRPQGGLLGSWLGGTALAPFELLIWAAGAFLLLTLLEAAFARLTRGRDG